MAMRRALSTSSSLTALLRLRLQLRLLPPLSPPSFSTRHLFSLPKSKTLASFEAPSSYDCSFGPNVSQFVSYVSSSPRVMEVEDQQLSGSEIGDGNRAELDGDLKHSIPVKAFFFSTSVDLKSLVEENKANFIPPTSRMTNYVVFKFGEVMPGSKGITGSFGESECTTYMVVYQYGSIVLFNVRNHKVGEYLEVVRKHASGWLPEMRKDEYEVKEKPTLDTWMQGGLDHILLQHLDVDGIRTIGSVLGQSIALDYYVRQVDGMVAEFTDINRDMEKSGTFTMKRKKLFQLVGKANSNLADVILKLGLFERSDIAWKDAKYAQIWEYLRDEFELTPRFASLDFKLKFVEHNIRFLQEILQNRRSDFLEWVIIILISAEILISLYGLIDDALEKQAPGSTQQPIDLTVQHRSELEDTPSAVLSSEASSSMKSPMGNSSIGDQDSNETEQK